eukprot:CAMPEP_0174756440 /NCGR_PEP_ID=MMETSP1094-20130205/106758_1 /TAXON_ID=156173 /ORGANISM="Chrysochromulina brevifilum, Strain UTEX LB 985" /LENGTH=76 /DNA_ID=CAMNT_0015962347 /DNA_START=164 /DNA_END=394 /DNA_ORIENTATION=-
MTSPEAVGQMAVRPGLESESTVTRCLSLPGGSKTRTTAKAWWDGLPPYAFRLGVKNMLTYSRFVVAQLAIRTVSGA